MEIKSVFSPEFRPYGKIVEGYDLAEFIQTLKKTPCPGDSVLYVPSDAELECLPVSKDLENRFFGGMPIQVGYCNGFNGTLNCLEYHRNSEVDIFAADAVLMVALEWEIEDGALHTDKVKLFQAPEGTAVELYATTLHYAPCGTNPGGCFRTAIILPRGTNTDKPGADPGDAEDRLLWARNKWLLAHPDAPEAHNGAYIGLMGENLHLF